MLLTLVCVAVVIAAVLIALDYGHWQSIGGRMDSAGKQRSLYEEAKALRLENKSMRKQMAQLRRNEDISRQARKDNHAEMVRLHSQIAELSDEVRFYRDIVDGTAVGVGPKVKGLRLKSLAGEGRYGYKLVLTHLNKDDQMAEGKLKLKVRGEREGQPETHSFASIVESGPGSLAFKFKHFHLFDGTFRMPKGFQPQQIEVSVHEKARRSVTQTQTYDWSSVLD